MIGHMGDAVNRHMDLRLGMQPDSHAEPEVVLLGVDIDGLVHTYTIYSQGIDCAVLRTLNSSPVRVEFGLLAPCTGAFWT
jgi:hypothetical protein